MNWGEISPEMRLRILRVCTEKQTWALQLQACGASLKAIGRVMGIDTSTARGHLAAAYRNLEKSMVLCACGEQVLETLLRLGSVSCQDCRDDPSRHALALDLRREGISGHDTDRRRTLEQKHEAEKRSDPPRAEARTDRDRNERRNAEEQPRNSGRGRTETPRDPSDRLRSQRRNPRHTT